MGGEHRDLRDSIDAPATLPATVVDRRGASEHARVEPDRYDAPACGDTIDRFVVLEVLGTGGMGVVYAAYDPELDRKVAIKLLGAQVEQLASARIRLKREAQAMGQLNHPNVLTVHDVGEYRRQIYIAMEFADGGTLGAWLRAGRRRSPDVVAAFVQAGRGLAAAHARGLVHRDFKPDNVLMFKDGRIRVTDFGLVGLAGEHARAPAGTLGNTPPLSGSLTVTGSVMGTPQYMAPEQFLGQVATPATDQFAFCIALYEALYGIRPFAGSTYEELTASVISGASPIVPSDAKVPGHLRRAVLRGLATRPADRFGSMAELLAELAHDPARRRRRIGVAAGAGAGALALGVATWFVLHRAPAAACDGADARRAVAWSPVRRAQLAQVFDASLRPDARSVFEHVATVADRWGQTWDQAYVGACEDTHVRKIQSEHLLDLRMDCLARRLDDARATVDLLVAGGGDVVDHALRAVLSLPSVAPCNDTAALLAAVPPPPTVTARVAVATIRHTLADAHAQHVLGQFATGLVLAKQALAAARTLEYGPVIAEALSTTGLLENDLADRGASETLRDAMEAAARAGDTGVLLDAAAQRVSILATRTGQLAQAEDLARLAGAIADHAAPSPEVAVSLESAMGQVAKERGQPKQAELHFERALEIARTKLGAAHPATIAILVRLGGLSVDQGRFDDGRRLLQEAVDAEQRVAGAGSPNVAYALNDLASVVERQGKIAEARALLDRAYAIALAALGPDHPMVAQMLGNLGACDLDAGQVKAARRELEQALAVLEKTYGDDSPKLVGPLDALAAALDQAGDDDGARTMQERARALLEKAYGPDDPRLTIELNNLAALASRQQHYADALAYQRRAEEIATKVYGPDHPTVADVLVNESATLQFLGKLDEAREVTSRALQVTAKAYGPDHPNMANALVNDGVLKERMKDLNGALESYQKALAIYEARLGNNNPRTAHALGVVGRTLVLLRRPTEAVAPFERAIASMTASQQPASSIADVRFDLAKALAARPATVARARAEAQRALDAYHQAKDADDAHDVERWLAAR